MSWVDPVNGDDSTGDVQDPDLPFKTLQAGIDATFNALIALGQGYGEVRALPGVYGPADVVGNGPNSSGDVLPIVMRDRISVLAVGGARRCIIRGTGDPNLSGGGVNLRWPDAQLGRNTSVVTREVLVDMSGVGHATRFPAGTNTTTPWYDEGDKNSGPAPTPEQYDFREVLDGFTLQGGDVQVLCLNGSQVNGYFKPRAVIRNCIFDMRHNIPGNVFDGTGFPIPVPGPWFGLMLCKEFTEGAGWDCSSPVVAGDYGYLDQEILVLNNTFVLSQYFPGNPGTGFEGAREGAVGIIDVTDPLCSSFQADQFHGFDCDDSFRGLGHAAIVNNIFRTGTYSPNPQFFPYAMLGIDEGDTLVDPVGVGGPIQTNVFATSRVGTTNGLFWSQPIANSLPSWVTPPLHELRDLWDCAGISGCAGAATTAMSCGPCTSPAGHTCIVGTFPTPRAGLALWNGTQGEIDPGFVGEFMAEPGFGQTSGFAYTDWRLLPSSPLKDEGFLPDSDDPLVMTNGVDYGPIGFTWDCEQYGNPRVIDDAIDIGADEIHLFTMTGNWGLDSQSHHVAPSLLNPDANLGVSTRAMILPLSVQTGPSSTVSLLGTTLKVNGAIQAPASSTPPAWSIQPPALASFASNPNLPRDYRTKYITFSNPGGAPTPWETTITISDQLQHPPIGGVTGQMFDILALDFVTDQECGTPPCGGDYFITQPVIKDDGSGSVLLRGNMQAEYR